MSIYVISNGAAYSDHRLHFVRSRASKDRVDDLLSAINHSAVMYNFLVLAHLPCDPTWFTNYRGTQSIEDVVNYYEDSWMYEENEKRVRELLVEARDDGVTGMTQAVSQTPSTADVYAQAVDTACAACMCDIEKDVPRAVYSRLNGPVRDRLLADNPYTQES